MRPLADFHLFFQLPELLVMILNIYSSGFFASWLKQGDGTKDLTQVIQLLSPSGLSERC